MEVAHFLPVVGIILIVGFLLFIVEFFIFPGTLIFGKLGVFIVLAGVALAYILMGPKYGTITFLGSVLLSAIFFYFGSKQIAKSKIAMKEVIDGKVNEFKDFGLKAGDIGTALSDLRPQGTVLFGEYRVNVVTQEGFISNGSLVCIAQIKDNKIVVKLQEESA